jgi:hypothetical protein
MKKKKKSVTKKPKPPRAHRRHETATLVDRIGRKISRRVDEAIDRVAMPVLNELEVLDQLLGDDDE